MQYKANIDEKSRDQLHVFFIYPCRIHAGIYSLFLGTTRFQD